MKVIYRAFDGQEFCEEYKCIEHEKESTSQVKEYANVIKEFCGMFEVCDDSCPFYNEKYMCCQLEENPTNW